jgi:peptidoglycan/xylan/chitin deacetylase (PgdA/CDA1 family)
VEKGFEIGNHTYTHINLKKTKDASVIQKEIGMNQKKISELIPGYILNTFSLPYGNPSPDLQHYVIKGEYEDISYEHIGIMEVGWDPSPSPVSKDFKPYSIHRVRATGIERVKTDLAWWLERLTREEQYVSDGDPDTIAVPESKKDALDPARAAGKKLVVY